MALGVRSRAQTNLDRASRPSSGRPRQWAWFALGAWALLLAASIPGLARLQLDPTPERLFVASDAAATAAASATSYWPDRRPELVVLVTGRTLKTTPGLAYLQALTQELAARSEVHSVDSVVTLPRLAWVDAVERGAKGNESDVVAPDGPDLDALEALAARDWNSVSSEEGALANDAMLEEEATKPSDSPSDRGVPGGPDDKRVPRTGGMPDDLVRSLDSFVRLAGDHFEYGLASLPEFSSNERSPVADPAEMAAFFVRGAGFDQRLISDDGTAVPIALFLHELPTELPARAALIASLEETIRAVPRPEGADVRMSGLLPLRTEIVLAMEQDQTTLLPLTVLMSALIMALAFRAVVPTLVALLAVALAGLATFGLMGWFGLSLTVLTSVLPALIVVIGLSDGVHIVLHCQSLMSRRWDRGAAAFESARRLLRPCLLTSATTMAGLLALCVTRNDVIRGFGLAGALGVGLAFLASVTLVPAVLALLPRWALGKLAARRTGRQVRRWLAQLTQWVLLHPVRLVLIGGLAACVAIPAALSVERTTSPLAHLDPASPTYQAARVIDDKLIGLEQATFSIRASEGFWYQSANLQGLDAVLSAALGTEAGVRFVEAPTPLLAQALRRLSPGGPGGLETLSPEAVRALVSVIRAQKPARVGISLAGDTLLVEIGLASSAVSQLPSLGRALEEQLSSALEANLEVTLFGSGASAASALGTLVGDLSLSLGLALLAILVLLRMALGSMRLALVALPTSLAPLVVAVGYMGLREMQLSAATAMIFTLSFGLAVDASIHLLAFIAPHMKARARLSSRLLVLAAARAGYAVTVASLALALGFGVLIFSAFPPIREFGELVGVTVFTCLCATLIYLPLLLRSLFPSRKGLGKGAPVTSG